MSTPSTSTASPLLSDALQQQIEACYAEVNVASHDAKQREIDACYNVLWTPIQQDEAVDARQRLIDACYAPAPEPVIIVEQEESKSALQDEIDACYAIAERKKKASKRAAPTITAACDGLNVWKAYVNGSFWGSVTSLTHIDALHQAQMLYRKSLPPASFSKKSRLKTVAKTVAPTKVYGRDVILSHHALVRFRKRSMSGVGSLEAAEKLLRLQIDHVAVSKTPPGWQRWHRKADGWIGTSKHSLPLMKNKDGKYVAVTFCHYNMMKLTDAEMSRTGRKVSPKAKRRARL